MRLLLACSADGYLAKSKKDDMGWTGSVDKALFRLLTLSSAKDMLLAGSTTFDQLPPLPGRQVRRLSRSIAGLDLEEADYKWPDAWLIGGAEVSVKALRLGLVTRAFICVSPVKLLEGIEASELFALLPREGPEFDIKVKDIQVKVFTENQKWPAK